VAVTARGTVQAKVELIEFQGGRCHWADDPSEMYETAARLARGTGH
jgi:cysteine synthase A